MSKKIKLSVEDKFRKFVRALPPGSKLYVKKTSVGSGFVVMEGQSLTKTGNKKGGIRAIVDVIGGRAKLIPWIAIGCKAWDATVKLLTITDDHELPF
jgi:hypothetical protein